MTPQLKQKKREILDVVEQAFANYGIINNIPRLIVNNIKEKELSSLLQDVRDRCPLAFVYSFFSWDQSKEGAEFWMSYSDKLEILCNENRFNGCKPPYRGWWHAPGDHSQHGPWRWWDGEAWSVGYDYKHQFQPNEKLFMFTPEESKNLCSWSFLWPKNARVQRINQDWHGFKGVAR